MCGRKVCISIDNLSYKSVEHPNVSSMEVDDVVARSACPRSSGKVRWREGEGWPDLAKSISVSTKA